MLTEQEMDSMLAERHSLNIQQILKASRVGIAGLGGLGSHIAILLARAGVGCLHLVDFDVVEPSNLNRQEYRQKHLGQKKTDALREQLLEINPYIRLICDSVLVTEENAYSLFQKDPIVCEAFDRPENKAILVNTLLEKDKEIILVSGSGMAGYKSSNLIKTEKKLKRLYLCGDKENGIAPGNPLMAPRVMVCAGHEANMVIRLLLGEKET